MEEKQDDEVRNEPTQTSSTLKLWNCVNAVDVVVVVVAAVVGETMKHAIPLFLLVGNFSL